MSANNNSTIPRPSPPIDIDRDLMAKGWTRDLPTPTTDAFKHFRACLGSQKEWLNYYRDSWTEEQRQRNLDKVSFESTIDGLRSQIKQIQESHAAIIK